MPDFKALVRRRIAPLALGDEAEQKVIEEWASQIEDAYDALRAAGASDARAWAEVVRQVEAADPAREVRHLQPLPASRRVRGAAVWLRRALTAGIGRDLRGAVRLLVRRPAAAATVVLTLAICLGANAAIFTVVDRVLLEPLPVPDANRIVGLGDVYPTITPNDILSNDVPSYFDRLQALTTLESQGLFTFWFDSVTIDGVPRELRGLRATPSVFRVLGVAPALGRTFTDAEGEVGNDHKIVLSDGLWRRLFGAAPDVIGRTVRLTWTGTLYTVVGVMPRGFSFFDRGYEGRAGDGDGVQFFIPLALTAEQKSDAARTSYGYFHIARLKPGATVAQVQEQLDALHAVNVKRFPQFAFDQLGMYSQVTLLQEALTRPVRRTLYLLWAGAGLVLLIGAINLATLALARSHERRRELATRRALGASRAQLARQLIIEALVPAAIGGVAGVATGAALLAGLAANGLAQLPNAAAVEMPSATIAITMTVALLVGLVTGLVQAAAVSGRAIGDRLGEAGRAATGGRASAWFRRTLVVAQVGLSVVLLAGAALFFTSFRYLLRLDAGFRPDGVVTATIFPPPSRYPDQQSLVALQDRFLERVREIPGTAAAGITSNIALSGFESPSTVAAAGHERETGSSVVPSVVAITPGYFRAMGTPLVRGRDFADSDRADSQRVAIVDEALAARLWPGQDAIGQGLFRGEAGPYTVVGVVRAIRLEGLTTSIPSIGTAYFPHTQTPPMRRLRWVVIKSTLDRASVVRALQSALASIDPDLPLADVQTMDERTGNAVVPQRLTMSLAMLFAAVALLLSVLGLYGVLAGAVVRRTREIGIRLALGDTLRGIVRLVLREAFVLVGVGLALGVCGALAAGRALKGLVFGVQPGDPVLLVCVAAVTALVALLACIQPALRATRVDPIAVLTDV